MAGHRHTRSEVDLEEAWVMAKSPLLRIHGTPIFLIQVEKKDSPDEEVFLLGRGDETATLHLQVSVGMSYTFRGLIATTITKGTDTPRKILLLTGSSKVLAADHAVHEEPRDIQMYKGTVTKCIDKYLGIYETHDNQRFYLTYQYDGKSHLSVIPVGSKVTIHNAHSVVHSDTESDSSGTSQGNLVCCMRTSVVVEETQAAHPFKDQSDRDKQQRVLLGLCVKLHPTLTVFEWLRCVAVPTLARKLVPDLVRMKEMLSVLLKLLTLRMSHSEEPMVQARPRNLYEEFMSHQTACHFSNLQSKKRIMPWVFPSVSDLEGCFSTQLPNNVTSVEQPGWTCRMVSSRDIQPTMVIVAQLCANGQTGKLYLKDSTGAISCAIIQSLFFQVPVNSINLNAKDGGDSKTDPEPQPPINSCFPHPCINHVLRISNFIIVQEKLHSERTGRDNIRQNTKESSRVGGNGNDSVSSKVTAYVLFSLRDAACVHQSGEEKETKQQKPRRRKRSSSSQSSPSDASAKQSDGALTAQLVCRRQFLQRTMPPGPADHRATNPAFYCDVLISKTDNTKRARTDDSEMESQMTDARREKEVECRAALLGFQCDAVSWYHFLKEGRRYQLVCSDEELQSQVSSSLTRLSKKGVTKPVYLISAFSQLLPLKNYDASDLPVGESAESLQAEMYQSGKKRVRPHVLTSISGEIVRKKANTEQEAHTSRHETPSSGHMITLELRDTRTFELVTVAIPADIHSNHLGLLPGARVTLRNCEKKPQPGQSSCYEVGPLTSIQVEGFSSRAFKEIATSSAAHTVTSALHVPMTTPEARTRSLLYHLVQNTSHKDPSTIIWVYAQVLFIRKLIVRWICDRCGRNDCMCPTSSHGKIITQVLLAVEDGTGECLMWSDNSRVVSGVLVHSARDWTKLEDCCSGPNKELVFHKWTKGQKEELAWDAGSSTSHRRAILQSTLSQYCQHNCIQRPLWFKCRHFREAAKDPSSIDKSPSPQGLVMYCMEVSSR